MIKIVFFGLLTMGAVFTARASDSTWLLCENGKLVVNLFEERNSTGDGRETLLKLMHGRHTLDGKLIEDDSDAILLLALPENVETDDPKKPSVVINSFTGTAKVNYKTKILSLKGELNLYGEKFSIKSNLKCKEMSPDLE